MLLIWKLELVLRNKELVIHACERVFDQGVVFLGAKEDADGRVVAAVMSFLFKDTVSSYYSGSLPGVNKV